MIPLLLRSRAWSKISLIHPRSRGFAQLSSFMISLDSAKQGWDYQEPKTSPTIALMTLESECRNLCSRLPLCTGKLGLDASWESRPTRVPRNWWSRGHVAWNTVIIALNVRHKWLSPSIQFFFCSLTTIPLCYAMYKCGSHLIDWKKQPLSSNILIETDASLSDRKMVIPDCFLERGVTLHSQRDCLWIIKTCWPWV